MAIQELVSRIQVESGPIKFTPAVRVIVNQPIGIEETADEAFSSQNGLDKIELTRSFWLTIGPPSFEKMTVMPPGGKILPSDEVLADNLVSKNEINPDEHSDAMVALASCRLVQEEIDLSGIRLREVHLLDSNPRSYTFNNGKSGRVEFFTTLIAPSHFIPYSFYSEKNISDVVRLPPSQVKKILNHNRMRHQGHEFPIIGNLNSENAERQAEGVKVEQANVISVRENIIKAISSTEVLFRLKLLKQLIFFSNNHPKYGKLPKEKAEKEYQAIAKKAENPSVFQAAYQQFLSDFEKKLPAEGSHKQCRQQKNQTMKQEFVQAWHRVLFKDDIFEATHHPIQGQLLAARLPLEDMTQDELEYLAVAGPEYASRFADFIDYALTPNRKRRGSSGKLEGLDISPELLEQLSMRPETAEDRYFRIELLRKLKLSESDPDNSEKNLLLLKLWQDYLYEEFDRHFGISKSQFPQISALYNQYNDEIQQDIAPQTAKKINAPVLLARSPESEVSQLEELLFNAFGYDQYQETNRGDITVLSPQNIFDARLKVFEMPLIAKALQRYYPAIHRSTYFWRRMIDNLCQRPNFIGNISAFSFMNRLPADDYIGKYLSFSRELMERDNPEEHYILNFNNDGRGVASQIYEADTRGVLAHHRKTKLLYKDVPIYFFELTHDKNILHFLRKMWEGGRKPEKILDAYGTAIILDTESAEIREALKVEYKKYQKEQKTIGHHANTFEQWKHQWTLDVIRISLVGALRKNAADINYSYEEVEWKDVLEDKAPTGGSAASGGGYSELKFYAQIDLTTPLVGGEENQSEEAEEIEVTIYPNIQEFLTKIFGNDQVRGDREYDLLRREKFVPGSGLYPLWQLEFPPHIYADVYPSITAYEAQRRKKQKEKEIQKSLSKIFGRISAIIFTRK